MVTVKIPEDNDILGQHEEMVSENLSPDLQGNGPVVSERNAEPKPGIAYVPCHPQTAFRWCGNHLRKILIQITALEL